MIDSKPALITALQSGATPKYLYFWNYHPSRDGSITKTCFAQWWEGSPFFADNVIYPTAEHFMMAGKARLFDDTAILADIITATHPRQAKDLGCKVKNFDPVVWEKYCRSIVVEGNYYKFTQNAALRKFLLDTGDRVLVEASPVDAIWGIGLSEEDAEVTPPDKWPGENLLGFALMVVRDRIRNLAATTSI
jgi:ribA/ribD-fused uncharacterized protein